MMSTALAIENLRAALACLPGVGPKSAQRMAYYLIERNREGARGIASALMHALDSIQHCRRCNNLSEAELCPLCTSSSRRHSLLCIIETPADLEAIEQTGSYKGCYFVLMGTISPLDGIGPDNIAIERLLEVLKEFEIEEIIIATNLTAEGETTAEYLIDLLSGNDVAKNIRLTRIARGVPVGGELEYIDRNTVARAINDRQAIEQKLPRVSEEDA